MNEVKLLNPAIEASVCQKLIGHVKDAIEVSEKKVTHGVLDREEYLQCMGSLFALRAVLKKMETEYRRNFEV